MNRNIALVVTDFDGTLWSEDHVIHHRSLQAMHSLLASGVILLGATARRPGTAQTILKRHGMELPTVYFDGSLAVDLDPHSVFHIVTFDENDATHVLGAFEAVGLEPYINVVSEDNIDCIMGSNPSTHPRHIETLRNWSRVASLDATAATNNVLSLGLCGVERSLLDEVARGAKAYGEVTVSVDRQYGGFTISVRPYGVNKWTAVEAFIARRGITDGAVLAIGDGENDLELLTNADVSCAVAGACQAVLNVGTYNVGPPDQGGWAAIMDLVQRAESPG